MAADQDSLAHSTRPIARKRRKNIYRYKTRLYADLWGKNSASPYFNRSFGQEWVAHLAFEHILAIEWGKSPS
jgi:hypothetical protein